MSLTPTKPKSYEEEIAHIIEMYSAHQITAPEELEMMEQASIKWNGSVKCQSHRCEGCLDG